MRTAFAMIVLAATSLTACASAPARLDDARLTAELQRRPVVLLGEVHDNSEQHRVRQSALAQLFASGARPALAFEQFDHERQADLERARRETPPDGQTLAQHVVAVARTPRDTWNWDHYRPYLELALQYDLPIVAANLSRATAARIAREGYGAVFSDEQQRALGLDRIDNDLQAWHERIADEAHCRLLPAAALPGMARAQIARDAVLARSIRPHAARGVVLLTGNGHARNDVGVPRHLTPAERGRAWSIGLLEEGTEDWQSHYDAALVSTPHPRDDPCRPLRR